MHPVEQLWQKHHPSTGYPRGVVPVPTPISGIAFFPGGFGLYRTDIGEPLPPFPVGRVMVLGHDFHSEVGYRASLDRRREAATQPTWRNLLALLAAVDIKPTDCFFTNIYMGLREGNATTGRFPGAGDQRFEYHCPRFLLEQLAALRPSLRLTLGINVPPFLGLVVPDLSDWIAARGLKLLDAAEPVRYRVSLPVCPAAKATVVALTHPSLRHASVRCRRYRGNVGHAAEVAMLRDALESIAPAV